MIKKHYTVQCKRHYSFSYRQIVGFSTDFNLDYKIKAKKIYKTKEFMYNGLRYMFSWYPYQES